MGMENVYIFEQGTQLHKDGLRLLVKRGSETIDAIQTRDLEQIILAGNVTLTPPVMDHLIQDRVDTVFLSMTGRFRGRLLTQFTKNVELRRAQYFAFDDSEKVLAFARAIVAGKIKNQRILLLRQNRTLKNEKIATALSRMRSAADGAKEARTQESLMGHEGAAGRAYFSVFDHLLKNEAFVFSGRNRRPPKDPVNALLSFGYTILANAVETAVNIVGLDPYLGAYHAAEYGRPSLVCDLMEEFRPFFVDSPVVAMINRRGVGPDDFVYREVSDPDAAYEDDTTREDCLPVSMKRHTMKAVVRLFEQKLASTVLYPPTGENMSYRQVILQQVRRCARVILGKEDQYVPFTWSR